MMMMMMMMMILVQVHLCQLFTVPFFLMLCELLGNFAWDILCTSANPLKEQVLRPESVMGSNFRCIPPITHISVVKHRVTLLRLSSGSMFLQNEDKSL